MKVHVVHAGDGCTCGIDGGGLPDPVHQGLSDPVDSRRSISVGCFWVFFFSLVELH